MRDRAKNYDKMTYQEMRELGKTTAEQQDINGAFYRSSRGAGATSAGMQGVLGSGDYGYIAKGRINNTKQRIMSAGLSNASKGSQQNSRYGGSRRQNSEVQQPPSMADAVSYASRMSGASSKRRGMAMYGSVDVTKANSKFPSKYYSNAQPVKQPRFNEDFDAKSYVSRASGSVQAAMSAKNLANFTPNLKAGSKLGSVA